MNAAPHSRSSLRRPTSTTSSRPSPSSTAFRPWPGAPGAHVLPRRQWPSCGRPPQLLARMQPHCLPRRGVRPGQQPPLGRESAARRPRCRRRRRRPECGKLRSTRLISPAPACGPRSIASHGFEGMITRRGYRGGTRRRTHPAYRRRRHRDRRQSRRRRTRSHQCASC